MRRSIAQSARRASSTTQACPPRTRRNQPSLRCFATSTPSPATPLPITATGPPPSAPVPAASEYGERIDRRRRQAEMLRQGQELRAATKPMSRTSPLKKRFWNDVLVKETPEGYQIYLDVRPVRTPSKHVLCIPLSKPQLAHAVAIEWDLLVSAQQALKNHNIPMTSMVSRAQDIVDAETAIGDTRARDEITAMLMRYLETDTLLCWAPEKSIHDATLGAEPQSSLRDLQIKTAQPIVGYLNTSVWPGVEIQPVLTSDSILPRKQTEVTRSIIRGWITGLPPYELAALERAALATKSLMVGTRLLIEWSEHFRHLQKPGAESRFGIEEAAAASTLEVRWQTRLWGEVEDTHDVDREDMRRQLGSVVLLVSGNR